MIENRPNRPNTVLTSGSMWGGRITCLRSLWKAQWRLHLKIARRPRIFLLNLIEQVIRRLRISAHGEKSQILAMAPAINCCAPSNPA